jgi:acyl-CoA reductase-like NAD-dependent aldehyde dehydrogenase
VGRLRVTGWFGDFPGHLIGPLARDDLRATIQRQAEKSVAVGARLLTGGKPLPGDGYFYQPTVLTDTGPGMPAFDEETFGPLAAIAVAQDYEDAVRLANATVYGLGLSVWTADPGRGVALARRVTSGAAFVNAIVASDPRLPTGSPPDRITPLPQPIPGPVCIHPGRQVLALPARTLHLAGPVGSLGEERR